MGFFGALIGLAAEAGPVAWALLGAAPLLFFLTFLVDGRTSREHEVHPAAVAGALVSLLATVLALGWLTIPFFIAHGFSIAALIAALIYAAVFVVALRYVIKAGSLTGLAWKRSIQR